jgi:hypothetical protein
MTHKQNTQPSMECESNSNWNYDPKGQNINNEVKTNQNVNPSEPSK